MADVSIATVDTQQARVRRAVVAIPGGSTIYAFYVAADGDLEYVKSTDNGATWGAPVQVSADDTIRAASVWYDRWTPGDTTGTKIHVAWVGSDSDDTLYRSLDTNGDTLGTQTTVFTGASALGNSEVWCSVAKARDGKLGVAFCTDAGDERGFYISSDAGATWGSNLNTATFVEDGGAGTTPDLGALFPDGTGATDDFWMLYQDGSANAITLKRWDTSAGTDSESAAILTLAENATDLVGQVGWNAGIRISDGHLILAAVTEYDAATADHRVFDITDQSTIAEKTAITTDVDDHYHPAVCVSSLDGNDIVVAFNGLRDGSEDLGTATKVYYVLSGDGGSTWSAGSTVYMEGAAEAVAQVWTAPSSDRFYAAWRTGTALKGNTANLLAFSAPSGGAATRPAGINRGLINNGLINGGLIR